jgi:hypothetical protein
MGIQYMEQCMQGGRSIERVCRWLRGGYVFDESITEFVDKYQPTTRDLIGQMMPEKRARESVSPPTIDVDGSI